MLSDDGKEVTPVKAAGGQPGRGARVESARKRAEEAGARKREQKVAEEHESRLLADDADARAELEGIVAASVAAAVQKESARVTAQLTALTRTLEALSHRATFSPPEPSSLPAGGAPPLPRASGPPPRAPRDDYPADFGTPADAATWLGADEGGERARAAVDGAFGFAAAGRPRLGPRLGVGGGLNPEYRQDRTLPASGRYAWPAARLLRGDFEAAYLQPQELAEVVPGYPKVTKAEQHELLHTYPCAARLADVLHWFDAGAYDLPPPVVAALRAAYGIVEGRVSYLEQTALVGAGLRSQSRPYGLVGDAARGAPCHAGAG